MKQGAALMTIFLRWLFGLLAVCGMSSCSDRNEVSVHAGAAMGTTYRIKAAGKVDLAALGIDELLAGMTMDFSTWRGDSWVGRFNAAPAGTTMDMPDDVAMLLDLSRRMSERTDGRFDPTIGALIRVWGFGAWRREWMADPLDEEVAEAREASGFRNLRVEGRQITKLHDGLMLDFSAIAKGHAVDRMAGLLRGAGVNDFLIEFGGDLLAVGNAPGRSGWTVAGPALVEPVVLKDEAIATSGSEHQFREGKSHVIDPATGRPLKVGAPQYGRAKTCAEADALATARLVEMAEK